MSAERLSVWIAAMRPRTWPASLVPVMVGLAVASGEVDLDVGIATATIVAALALQVATNLANDYWDAERGIDGPARAGPVRATQSGLLSPRAVQRATWLALVVAAIAGAPLIARGGLPIAVVGIVSMIAAVAYSAGPRPLASLGMGELLAFLFFGLVAVAGTAYLHTLAVSAAAWAAGAAVGVHAAAIMLVNNLRDISTDAPAGKRTLAVRIGDARSRRLYGVLLVAAYGFVAVLAAIEAASTVLMACAAAPVAVAEIRALARRHGPALNASLAATARLELFFGLLLAVGLGIR
jgi:1,4-dihydroxy-2-naphthoate octaprenyltransferase